MYDVEYDIVRLTYDVVGCTYDIVGRRTMSYLARIQMSEGDSEDRGRGASLSAEETDSDIWNLALYDIIYDIRRY